MIDFVLSHIQGGSVPGDGPFSFRIILIWAWLSGWPVVNYHDLWQQLLFVIYFFIHGVGVAIATLTFPIKHLIIRFR